MRVIMDADCLIKLTKANLKDYVCAYCQVVMPETVRKEVVDEGEGRTDAAVVAANIEKGILMVDDRCDLSERGEESVFLLYRGGGFDAVCSDDKTFIKKLRLLDIPYITPAVFVPLLLRDGKLTLPEAKIRLEALSPFISSDEYLTVQLALEDWRIS